MTNPLKQQGRKGKNVVLKINNVKNNKYAAFLNTIRENY